MYDKYFCGWVWLVGRFCVERKLCWQSMNWPPNSNNNKKGSHFGSGDSVRDPWPVIVSTMNQRMSVVLNDMESWLPIANSPQQKLTQGLTPQHPTPRVHYKTVRTDSKTCGCTTSPSSVATHTHNTRDVVVYLPINNNEVRDNIIGPPTTRIPMWSSCFSKWRTTTTVVVDDDHDDSSNNTTTTTQHDDCDPFVRLNNPHYMDPSSLSSIES